MHELGISESKVMDWIHEWLVERFSGQPLRSRLGEENTVIVDLNDSHGRPKELRISRQFLVMWSMQTQQTVEKYLRENIADQIETEPHSATILDPA
jgi:hypothetical protein